MGAACSTEGRDEAEAPVRQVLLLAPGIATRNKKLLIAMASNLIKRNNQKEI